MLANFSRVNAAADVDELVFFFGRVKEATRSFADLADRFRKATSSQIPPSIFKHEINTVFATQAGDLLCQCWRRGMLSVYRPHFYLPGEDEPRIRYVLSWFTFIRWHLATVFKTRFRDDWKSEFAQEIDQLKGLDHHPQKEYQSAASEDANDLVVWRLSLHADVQATACDILAEELEKLAEAIEQHLRQRPGGTPAKSKGRRRKSKTKNKEDFDRTLFDWLKLYHEYGSKTKFHNRPTGCREFENWINEHPGRDSYKTNATAVSRLFKSAFGSHKKYKILCGEEENETDVLALEMKFELLNGDMTNEGFRRLVETSISDRPKEAELDVD